MPRFVSESPHRFFPCLCRLLALSVGYLFLSASAYAFDLKGYWEQNQGLSKDAFLQNFPYDDYLKDVRIIDFQTLQRDRRFLWEKFGDGDEFLYYLGDKFIESYPPLMPVTELSKKVDIGEAYLTAKRGFNQGTDEIYQIIGFYILGKVARKIEEEMKNKKFDVNDAANHNVIQRLEKNKIYVSIPESQGQKLARSFWKDPWYVIRRGLGVLKEHSVAAIAVCAAATLFLIWFVKKVRNRVLKRAGVLVAAMLIGAMILSLVIDDNLFARSARAANFQLQLYKEYYPISGGKGNAVQIFKLQDKSGADIGHVIWLQRPSIEATYFAYQNVPAKYDKFKASNNVILATTGGFTNASAQPEGFTIEAGNIVNAVFQYDRDGLVMFSKGGINVLNLKRDDFILPNGEAIKNPLRSLVAYSRLLHWCKVNAATLFQTQLLAFSDNIAISKAKAKTQIRERRILATARDKTTNELHHVVFNITKPYNLAEIADEIFSILGSRNKKIEAVLNLDVGSYDILDVFDEKRNLMPDVKGNVAVNRATNLIVYSK